MKAIHIKPLTPSVPPPYTDAHTRSLTHARTHSQYSIQALHNPVRQMGRLQTRTYTTSKRQSGRAAEREEKGGRWFTRETEPEREADLTSAAPQPTPFHHPPPIPFQNKRTILIKRGREIPGVWATAPFTPAGLHLGPFTPHVCACAYVRMSVRGRGYEGAGVGNERHGVLSNSPPHLMAQLHHYLAHTLGQNRLLGRRIDKSITLSMRRGGGHSSLPGTHCRSQRN